MMFFYLSKFVWFLLQPSSLIAAVLLLGLLLCFKERWLRAGRRLVGLGFIGLIVGGISPLANWLILPLENRVARADLSQGKPVTGIIVLGGSENGRVSLARGTLALNEGGERVTEGAVLARRFPNAKILFSGGAAQFIREEKPGAPTIAAFWSAMGIAKSRILLEQSSRNTYENAVFSKRAVQPKPADRWLLVTSAFHMPRALGSFRKAGFDVAPWPVDFRTKGRGDLQRPFNSIAKGLRRLDVAAKEWLGLVIYYAAGRTSELFAR